MTAFIKLNNPPLKEIIFTISFNESLSIQKLDSFKALPEIASLFKVVDKGFNTHLVAKKNESPISKTSFDGYVFRSPMPTSRIIQARRGLLSYHKVNGYETFEKLLGELEGYWKLLIQCCGVLTVNNLNVRYLNFIEKSENEEANDLLTINIKHPFGNSINNSFTQHTFNYDQNPQIVATVVAAKGKEQDREGIILDIILNKKISASQNYHEIFSSFTDMREAKNDLFFRSITEKTINKYNQ